MCQVFEPPQEKPGRIDTDYVWVANTGVEVVQKDKSLCGVHYLQFTAIYQCALLGSDAYFLSSFQGV